VFVPQSRSAESLDCLENDGAAKYVCNMYCATLTSPADQSRLFNFNVQPHFTDRISGSSTDTPYTHKNDRNSANKHRVVSGLIAAQTDQDPMLIGMYQVAPSGP
jgi:hypothetical protein